MKRDAKPRQGGGKPVTKQKGGSFKPGNSSSNPNRVVPGGAKKTHFRSKSTIKRLNMYGDKPDIAKMKEKPLEPKRIQPDRRWFGNTRVITQSKLQTFREEIGKSVHDPFQVVLNQSKLPMSLLTYPKDAKTVRANILSCEPYSETFGSKAQRKRPKLAVTDLSSLMQSAEARMDEFESSGKAAASEAALEGLTPEKDEASEEVFKKGTSRRIWQELYKVVDSSDVILQVIDARDPMGTRCMQFERELKKNRPGKYLVLVLNKCDLVPTWVTRQWVAELSKEYPTVAFHASITKSFGKSALLQLLRQFSGLLKDRKHVSVGFVGYPNVGKSSVINTLKAKKVCKAAPIPGETKVWQYIALTKRIYLIDCPGIVPSDGSQTDAAKVLKGVVRPERLEAPSMYIDEVLARVKPKYLIKKYSLAIDATWKDGEDFLTMVATKMGKLIRGGDADLETTARVVLYDWQKGRLPFFTPPPGSSSEDIAKAEDQLIQDEDTAAGSDALPNEGENSDVSE